MNPAEKRRNPRRALPARCWILDGQHTVYLRLHDLSLGGLSVSAPMPFAPHAKVEVRLELPDGKSARARGEVVWVRPSGGESGPRMGARFVEMLAGEQDLYNALSRPES
jgi:hypothetical protein